MPEVVGGAQRRVIREFARRPARVVPRQGSGHVGESMALIGADVADGRLHIVHESDEKLPACFVVTLPGSKRAEVRAFLKWPKAQK
ncbi:MAG: hypothetical protein ACK4FR_04425 [Tabrizicola sp.]